MCAAVARTEQKYSIPRNPIIPQQTALAMLASGSLFKSQNGAAEGSPCPSRRFMLSRKPLASRVQPNVSSLG